MQITTELADPVKPSGIADAGPSFHDLQKQMDQMRLDMQRMMGSNTHSSPMEQLNVFESSFSGNHLINSSVESSLGSWILDSGATCHVCNSASLLTNLICLDTPVLLYMPNGSSQTSTHTGDEMLSENITLRNVHLVPAFAYCIISVPKFYIDSTLMVCFSGTGCILQGRDDGKEKGRGILRGHLYYFQSAEGYFRVNNVQGINELWHNRLGHPSFAV